MALNLPFLPSAATDRVGAKATPIQKFVAQVKANGMARTNRYAVNIAPPQKLVSGNLENILLFCDQIQLPGANYSTVENRIYGEFRQVPYEKLYDSCSLTFYVDNDMKVKEFFDNWMNLIANPVQRNYNYYKDYIGDVDIQVQDINDKKKYQLHMYECYPKNISSIQMDYASKDVMKLTVEMQYKYWLASPVQELANGEEVSTSLLDKFTKDFTGFQTALNDIIGPRLGNALTGSVITYGVTKLPGLLKF